MSGESFEGAMEGHESGGGICKKLDGYESPVLPEMLLVGGRVCRAEREVDRGGSTSLMLEPVSSTNRPSSSSSKGS
jgi:hypothetical protein